MLTMPVTILKMPIDVDIGLTNGWFSAAHLGMKSCLVVLLSQQVRSVSLKRNAGNAEDPTRSRTTRGVSDVVRLAGFEDALLFAM